MCMQLHRWRGEGEGLWVEIECRGIAGMLFNDYRKGLIDFPLSVLGSLFALFQPMHSGLTLTMINAKWRKYESHKNLPLFLCCRNLLRFLLRRFREKMWKPSNRKTHRHICCVCSCVCSCVCVLWPAQFLWHQSLTLPLRQAMATNQRSQRHKLLLSFCCYALWIYCETNAKRKKNQINQKKTIRHAEAPIHFQVLVFYDSFYTSYIQYILRCFLQPTYICYNNTNRWPCISNYFMRISILTDIQRFFLRCVAIS